MAVKRPNSKPELYFQDGGRLFSALLSGAESAIIAIPLYSLCTCSTRCNTGGICSSHCCGYHISIAADIATTIAVVSGDAFAVAVLAVAVAGALTAASRSSFLPLSPLLLLKLLQPLHSLLLCYCPFPPYRIGLTVHFGRYYCYAKSVVIATVAEHLLL